MKDFKDRLEILETEMRELEKIPQELERLRETLVQVLAFSLEALELDSTIRDYFFTSDRVNAETLKKLVKANLKSMKRFYESYDKTEVRNMVSGYMQKWMPTILLSVSFKQIEFNDFCSLVMENLGSDLAKKTITLEDIEKFYGAENATTWKKLIE